MSKSYYMPNIKTLEDLAYCIGRDASNDDKIYKDNIHPLVERLINEAGYVKEDFVKEIATKEIDRAYAEGHGEGYIEILMCLNHSTLIK